jgi:two-component system sensor histidine kinase SenX3
VSLAEVLIWSAVVAVVSAVATSLFIRRSGARRNGPAEQQVTAPKSADSPLPRQVLNAIDVGVVVVDRDEAAVFANRVARGMGVVKNDRLAVGELNELVRQVTDTGEPGRVTIELTPYRHRTDTVTFLVRAMPLKADSRVSAVVLRFSDITDARRLELVRRDFVANVSHELKTPVGALTLLAEAVQDAADDPEAVQRFAARMQREGDRLGRLVQELIELSRLQGADPLPGDNLVDIGKVVQEAIDRCRLRAEQAGIIVVERCDPDITVSGNEAQLATAVTNLVDNAIAYSPERTRVSVTARQTTDADGSTWIEIAVADQGIGIAESELGRVFERFYRVDPARSRATGGTGLGLSIVKHIATNHGGSVGVWSVVGSGSTFTIRLPASTSRAKPNPTPAQAPVDVVSLADAAALTERTTP